jgi:RimJ/RimL family protein N-acetyltransferase
MLGKWSGARLPVICREGHHVVLTEHLRMQSPSRSDIRIMLAAASDPEAQRWLGWRDRIVKRESRRKDLLAARPGRGRSPHPGMASSLYLAVIDPSTDLMAGAVGVNRRNGELGGWLAPLFRGRGLGAELFAGAAQFVHYHLGSASVVAGTETANVSCVRALRSAGFAATRGPEFHPLPDGRTVPVCWFRHDADKPARCEAEAKPLSHVNAN